ncbi:hypothetical protein OG292_03445 [Streptomyces sp. NBC_01511]|uniref:hypothetical protein n=1 Tax=unclassified Streptomyces TaxID=2593676 RepID=UPI003870AF4F
MTESSVDGMQWSVPVSGGEGIFPVYWLTVMDSVNGVDTDGPTSGVDVISSEAVAISYIPG